MANAMTRGEQNLLLLQSLIPESDSIYTWCYTSEGEFVATSCPLSIQSVLEKTFRCFGGMKKIQEYAHDSEDLPRLIGSSIGMQWALSYETERNRELIFVIGPVFYSRPDEKEIRRALESVQGKNAWKEDLCASLPLLPVAAYPIFTRYVILIHNTLSGQQISSLAMETGVLSEPAEMHDAQSHDRKKVYQAEQMMLSKVRQGDINYGSALKNSSELSPGVPVHGQDPLRQMKTSIIVFTTLVTRAAIEGGMDPEDAYPLGDTYIQTVENCRDSGELGAIANAMYHDFIYRVHVLHSNPAYSRAIQKCLDYINVSLERKIRIADLASLIGYTEYYLSEKFKKETGISISSYIKKARIERAKSFLEDTSMSVRDIAYKLAFNTPNYFIQCFKEETGYTPAQFRKMRKIESSDES